MRSVAAFNDGWVFHTGFSGALTTATTGGRPVTLPHNAVDLPLGYFDERTYQHAFTYQKSFRADRAWEGYEVWLCFDGAMADTVVYLNGVEVARHRDGYTPFEARLTGHLRAGENLIAVTLDGTENPGIPPFGDKIDYLTYAGIYRDVWLKVTDPVSIAGIKIETPEALGPSKSVRVHATLSNPHGLPVRGTLTATLRDSTGAALQAASIEAAMRVTIEMHKLGDLALWDLDHPTQYTIDVTLDDTDKVSARFGFRTAAFTPEGFRLNGKPLKLRGLSRHQSFPYVGYALGRSAQEHDANILKHVLKLNIVRTSHYPQSPWFLDECDRIGLLVFEEIPGWQHIGDKAWQAEAVENVRGMITRDWNHPSIVMWGVRIDESLDDHDFYLETNHVAHQLDPTRPTGGVRFHSDSELLEDVYAINDFVLGREELEGTPSRTALRPQREVTGLDHDVPYLVSEFGGHMYPTKSFDQEQRQAEHVRRHLEVLNAAYGDPTISGAIGWCAFDYNTHKDFGSGDRICYHGVTDIFREPKFAAYVYASQCEPSEEIVLQPVTYWSHGERNIGGVLPLIVLTNCDEIELSYAGNPPKRIGTDREAFPHLPHAPVIVDRRHFPDGKLGLWGGRWQDVTITGLVGGKPAKTIRYVADPVATRLQVVADSNQIAALAGDVVRVMIRALDQAGNKLPFLLEPVEIEVIGAAHLIGPDRVSLRAGSTGFWIASIGTSGPITINVSSPTFGTTTLELVAR